MTREEAYNRIDAIIAKYEIDDEYVTITNPKDYDAFRIARKTLEQEPKTGHWIYDRTIDNWKCSECNETPKTMGYVGSANFMTEHFKFCNHCGTKMSEIPTGSESEGKE